MEFQWLARYWAPDCSHSHIMRPGGILIILIILLVHFTTLPRPPRHRGWILRVRVITKNGLDSFGNLLGTDPLLYIPRQLP